MNQKENNWFVAVLDGSIEKIKAMLDSGSERFLSFQYPLSAKFPEKLMDSVRKAFGKDLHFMNALQLALIRKMEDSEERSEVWKEVIQVLLKNLSYEDVDQAWGTSHNVACTTLHLACFLGEFTVVQSLLSMGADNTIKNINGYTPSDLIDGDDTVLLELVKKENTHFGRNLSTKKITPNDLNSDRLTVTQMKQKAEFKRSNTSSIVRKDFSKIDTKTSVAALKKRFESPSDTPQSPFSPKLSSPFAPKIDSPLLNKSLVKERSALFDKPVDESKTLVPLSDHTTTKVDEATPGFDSRSPRESENEHDESEMISRYSATFIHSIIEGYSAFEPAEVHDQVENPPVSDSNHVEQHLQTTMLVPFVNYASIHAPKTAEGTYVSELREFSNHLSGLGARLFVDHQEDFSLALIPYINYSAMFVPKKPKRTQKVSFPMPEDEVNQINIDEETVSSFIPDSSQMVLEKVFGGNLATSMSKSLNSLRAEKTVEKIKMTNTGLKKTKVSKLKSEFNISSPISSLSLSDSHYSNPISLPQLNISNLDLSEDYVPDDPSTRRRGNSMHGLEPKYRISKLIVKEDSQFSLECESPKVGNLNPLVPKFETLGKLVLKLETVKGLSVPKGASEIEHVYLQVRSGEVTKTSAKLPPSPDLHLLEDFIVDIQDHNQTLECELHVKFKNKVSKKGSLFNFGRKSTAAIARHKEAEEQSDVVFSRLLLHFNEALLANCHDKCVKSAAKWESQTPAPTKMTKSFSKLSFMRSKKALKLDKLPTCSDLHINLCFLTQKEILSSKLQKVPSSIEECQRWLDERACANRILYEGFISIRGNQIKHWRRRFIRWVDSTIETFHEMSLKPMGTIDLSNFQSWVSSGGSGTLVKLFDDPPLENSFRIQFDSENVMEFYTDNERDFLQCVEALNDSIPNSRNRKFW